MQGQLREQAMHNTQTEAKALWARLLPNEPIPADDQWDLWFALHDPAVVRSAIAQTTLKVRKHGAMECDHILRFASAVMNRLSKERRVIAA